MSRPARSRGRSLKVHGLATCLLLLVAATGCGGGHRNHDGDPFNDDPEIEGTVELEDRPSMESVLTKYNNFQSDLFEQLGKVFGPRPWRRSNGEDGISGAGCGTNLPPEWLVVGLPNMTFDGTYPPEDWHRVRDLVIEVGKQHGFTEITPMVDVTGNLDFFGNDPRYGGRYEFGMGNNAVFGIETGCHRWDKVPPPPTPPPALP